jgi:hypothetical protein
LASVLESIYFRHFIAKFEAPKFQEFSPEELINELIDGFRVVLLPGIVGLMVDLAD